MKIIIARSFNKTHIRRCIDTLMQYTPINNIDIIIVHERGFREQTLNKGLSLAGNDDDVLFVGDDIEFTPGWYQALQDNYDKADIIGFSMLYPGTDKIQDRGYDLVQIDNRVSLEARDRGLLINNAISFGIRYCDSICGCLMFVNKRVLNYVSKFKDDGQNRWGEFIFISEARKIAKARIAVIDHFLYHHGVSTKANPDPKFSSISYQIERDLWGVLVNRYVDRNWVSIHRETEFSQDLLNELNNPTNKILLYGVGTVTEKILENCPHINIDNIIFSTGLDEEIGMIILDKEVKNVRTLNFSSFNFILITPLYIGEKIYDQHFSTRLPHDFTGRICYIETLSNKKNLKYQILDLIK